MYKDFGPSRKGNRPSGVFRGISSRSKGFSIAVAALWEGWFFSDSCPIGVLALALTALWCSTLGLGAQSYGMSQRPVVGPFLNNALPKMEPITTSWSAVAAFPNIGFDDPTFLVAEPRTNRLYVLSRQGTIHFFVNDPATTNKTLFLNLTPHTQGYQDCGLVGMAFHPEYGIPGSTNRNYVYVYYEYSPSPVGPNPPVDTLGYDRLSRFTVPDGSLIADPNSELILLNQFDRHLWHNGGAMFFGPDGFLYVSIGDEGGANDLYNQTQELNSGLFSGILRIDVDRIPSRSHPIRRQPRIDQAPPNGWPATFSTNYYIPNDNPWLNPAGTILEEFWAIGFRSPHRMTYDPPTGHIWLGDVGQESWEEVDLIEKGGNYQWSYLEATHPGPRPKPNPLTGVDKPPVYEYLHATGNNCVIGGYVYRGAQHAASLGGKYIFGDNGSCRVWAMSYDGVNAPTLTQLCVVPNGGTEYTGLSSFGLDQNGELYMCVMGENTRIYKLAPAGAQGNLPPALLSQTGAFTNLTALVPSPALVPYTVNAPLWSDNAVKSRWMVVPNDGAPYSAAETIAFSANGSWSFPTGTVFVKHFELPIDDTNPALRKRLETRFLVRGTNGAFQGFTYKWRPDHSDADLLPGSLNETNLITTSTGVRTQVWYYPSPQDCMVCHNPNAKYVLGARTCQLNGNYTYPESGVTDNQLRTLNHIGMFNPAISEAAIPSYPRSAAITDTNATLELRVRSYLDANCAQCHRPSGVQAFFDARLDTPLEQQGIVNGSVANALGISGAKVVAPLSIGQSILHVRDNLVGQGQMPPLAKNLVDSNYISVLTQWINSLPPSTGPILALGNTNDGTFQDVMAISSINAGRFQATATVPVNAIFAKVTSIPGHFKCAIYSDNGGLPNRFLRGSVEASNPGSGWQSFPLTSSVMVTNGLFYWLAIWSDDATAETFYSGNGGALRWGTYSYGAWPDPIVTAGGADITYCIYAVGAAPTLLNIGVLPLTPTVFNGDTLQFTATGTYSDSSVLDLTGVATWTSSDETVATIDSAGLATALSVGNTGISAQLGSVSSGDTLTVLALPQITILSIDVSPSVSVTATAVAGRNYTLQYVENLGDTNWVPILPPVTASGSTVTLTDDPEGNSQRFYRIQQSAP